MTEETKKCSPIFAYLKSEGLNKIDVKRIREAGYLTLAVESFGSFRVIEPIPAATVNALSGAALQTVLEGGYSSVKELFGKKVATILVGQQSNNQRTEGA